MIALLYPIVVDPMFNTFTPLRDTEWRHLEPRVRELLGTAGIPVEDILVMDASRQGSHSNAYFTGFGATRRIVLYDNLLASHTEDEVLSILAHEIGHWRHDHIVKGLSLAGLAAILACFLLSRLLLALVDRPPWKLHSPSDPRVLPLLLLLAVLASWLSTPVQNAVSRYFERQADRAALELAGKPKAFIDAEITLSRKNKSNVTPHAFNAWLFGSHPTALERIEMGRQWGK
jgi:STE24 endopeptidase